MKETILYILKTVGLFKLFRYINRKKLFIVCYHGISQEDEHKFKGSVFISKELFMDRINYFAKSTNVLALEDALERMYTKDLPNNSVVVTVDDGWYSTVKDIQPAMASHNLPYTIYVTTYYAEKETPVFNIFIDYLFWKTNKERVNLDNLEVDAFTDKDTYKGEKSIAFSKSLIQEYGATRPIDEKIDLIKNLGIELNIETQSIIENRVFGLLNKEEAINLHEAGVDLQLHTHRHIFPKNNQAEAQKELIENKAILENWLGVKREHFCYPSGSYDLNYEEMLNTIGIKSATTCIPNLNSKKTNPLFLNRFLDGEHISQITLEAEYCGLLGFVRQLLGRQNI